MAESPPHSFLALLCSAADAAHAHEQASKPLPSPATDEDAQQKQPPQPQLHHHQPTSPRLRPPQLQPPPPQHNQLPPPPPPAPVFSPPAAVGPPHAWANSTTSTPGQAHVTLLPVRGTDTADASCSGNTSSAASNQPYSGTRATRQQLRALEQQFRENPLPTGVMHHTIAERLGMTRKAVRNWFQNTRAKVRRLALQGDPAAAEILHTINELQKRRSSEPYSLDWQRQQEESSLFSADPAAIVIRPPPPVPPPPLQSLTPSPAALSEITGSALQSSSSDHTTSNSTGSDATGNVNGGSKKPFVMSVEALIGKD